MMLAGPFWRISCANAANNSNMTSTASARFGSTLAARRCRRRRMPPPNPSHRWAVSRCRWGIVAEAGTKIAIVGEHVDVSPQLTRERLRVLQSDRTACRAPAPSWFVPGAFRGAIRGERPAALGSRNRATSRSCRNATPHPSACMPVWPPCRASSCSDSLTSTALLAEPANSSHIE